MLPNFGPVELILILVIVTMLFGVGKLPEVFGSVGKGVREFRKNSSGEADKGAPAVDAAPKAVVAEPPVVEQESQTVDYDTGKIVS